MNVKFTIIFSLVNTINYDRNKLSNYVLENLFSEDNFGAKTI